MIDLSAIDPDDLLATDEHLEEIPQCATGSPKRRKTKDSVQDNVDKSVDGSKASEPHDQSPDQTTPSHALQDKSYDSQDKSHDTKDKSHDSPDDTVFQDQPILKKENEFSPIDQFSPSSFK